MTNQTNSIYRYYIDENNQTHKRDIKKAIKVFKDFKIIGFTILKNLNGLWENNQEKSFIIEVINTLENPFNDNTAFKIKKQLEENLKQYLVLLTKQQLEVLS